MSWGRVLPIFRIEVTPEAERDIRAIAAHIQQDNPMAAKRVILEIKDQITMLVHFPDIGRAGRVDGTREMVIPGLPYIAIYEAGDAVVYIVRLLHGARQWP